MVRNSQERQKIEELIRQGQSARQSLGRQAVVLRRRLDVPARLRDSMVGHPAGWMAGSVFSGLAASLLFRRRPARVVKTKSRLLSLLMLLATALRPLVKVWLVNQLKRWLTRPQAAPASGRPVPRPLARNQPY